LEYIELYKGDIAIDGIAIYFDDINSKTCLALIEEGVGFKQNLIEIKVDQTFNEQYIEYYREWHK
jgi:adenosylcobinamide amidohydrolase